MKHRALTGLVASSVALLLTLGFACVDADIPNVSNDLRDTLAETFGNAGAPPLGASGNGGSASTPNAGAGGDGGAAGDGNEPAPANPDENGGAAGSGMAGGAGADGEGAAGGPPIASDCDGFGIIQQRCGLSGCHAPADAPLGDFGSSEDAARAYIGEEGVTCAGEGALIDPDDPGASVLVAKIEGTASCGGQMPPGGTPLSDEDIACVVEWIGSLEP
jgi:hypothetical protein